MNRFVYVFTAKDAKTLKKRGYELCKVDEKNQIWVYFNKDPDSLEFDEKDVQCVLSNEISF